MPVASSTRWRPISPDVADRFVRINSVDTGLCGQRQATGFFDFRITVFVGVCRNDTNPACLLRQFDGATDTSGQFSGNNPVRQVAIGSHFKGAQHGEIEPSATNQRKRRRAIHKSGAGHRVDVAAAGIDEVSIRRIYANLLANPNDSIFGMQQHFEIVGQVIHDLRRQSDTEIDRHSRFDIDRRAAQHALSSVQAHHTPPIIPADTPDDPQTGLRYECSRA